MTRLNEKGRKVYASLRRSVARGHSDRTAADARRLALEWQASPRPDYPGKSAGDSAIWSGLRGNAGAVFACNGERRVRWIEKPEASGLRFAGTAESLANLRHGGWYTDSDGSGELARGVVYLLPARRGRTRALAAIADPWNSDRDGNGPALVSLDIFEADLERERLDGARVIYGGDLSRLPDYCRGLGAWTEAAGEAVKAEAALAADGFAERYAEAERDFRDAFEAGRIARMKAAEAVVSAGRWKEAARALRSAFLSRHALPLGEARAMVRVLAQAVRSHCEDTREARDAARRLRDDAPRYAPCADAWREGYSEGGF